MKTNINKKDALPYHNKSNHEGDFFYYFDIRFHTKNWMTDSHYAEVEVNMPTFRVVQNYQKCRL